MSTNSVNQHDEPSQPRSTPRNADERKAAEESKAEPCSKPGGFKNDPDDPTNPNEVRERFLRKVRR